MVSDLPTSNNLLEHAVHDEASTVVKLADVVAPVRLRLVVPPDDGVAEHVPGERR